nr:Queuosine biosynthesis protein [uncultured bacterium]
MQLSDFDFNLPKELIAQSPARPRDHARLLVYDRKTKQITDDYFYNLEKHIARGSTIVVNDSKVEKARLRFGSSEIFILKVVDPFTIKALVRPGRRFRTGLHTNFQIGLHRLHVETLSVDDEGVRVLKFDRPIDDPALDKYRLTPLPPYIAQDESLSEEYQTIYAEPLGSKAAPTAGLHFTAAQLAHLSATHPVARVTLHVGLGTFAPVKTAIDQHKMHSEQYIVSQTAADLLNKAGHITAVGTTSLRVLESLTKPFQETSGETDIFIKPGYSFKAVDSLITNFHLPKSTLLMLVAAFMGSTVEMQRIYSHAINSKYRFYSFGDAMLIV